MAYKVVFTKPCIQEINEVITYLLVELGNNPAAIKFEKRLQSVVEKLQEYPEMFQIVENDLFARKDIRRAIIGSYNLYYVFFSDKKEVVIFCLLHYKRQIKPLSIH